MRTRPETQPEINRFRRETLIEATIKVVAKHGIKNTTIAKICQAAGVSRGLSGHYFRDKDDLLCQAYQHLLDLHLEHTAAAAEAVKGGAAERLKARVKASLPADGNSHHYRMAYLSFWTLSMTNKKIAQITSDSYRALYESVAALLDAAAAEIGGEIDSHEESIALIGMIDGLWLDVSIGVPGITPKISIGIISKYIDRLLSLHGAAGARAGRARSGGRSLKTA
jgi:AcrR family transcriptional regulator